MSMINALHTLALSLAGADYLWDHTDAPKQMDSAHRQGFALIMAERQMGLCVACGDALGNEVTNVCHIVASRKSGRGIMPGNAYIGHATSCNDTDAKEFGAVVPLSSLLRIDLLVLSFPTRAECIARVHAAKELKMTRAARRHSAVAASEA